MLRMSLSVRRDLASRFGMAVALACGVATSAVLIASPAQAQRQQRQQAPRADYSEAFAKVYQPVADVVNAETGDLAAAKAQIPGIVAAISTADDRFAAGNVALLLGNRLNDPALQRQGLELMIASGKADPAQLGQFQYFIGSLAYNARDFGAARTALQAALAAGYGGDDVEGLIAESYFQQGQAAPGLDYLKALVETRAAAGNPAPEAWILRGLKVAYDNRLGDKATEWSSLLVSRSPTEQNWLQALQVVNATNSLDGQVQLDLLRLMALTNALSDRSEFISYIEAADPRIMANEVGRVLDDGIRKGVFSQGDEYYQDVKRVVDERAPEDRADAPGLAARARTSSQARDAQNAGDVFLSLGAYAEAEEMFVLAIEKGPTDRDQILTRLGIAQVQQGKVEEAKATFGQVSGVRAPVARMWTVYAESRA